MNPILNKQASPTTTASHIPMKRDLSSVMKEVKAVKAVKAVVEPALPSVMVDEHPPGWYHNGEVSSTVFGNAAGVVMINIPTMSSYLSEICLGCASDYELSPNMYGLAHILEHMKCKAIPNGLDRWVLQGGAFQNASTNMDRTDFYALLPGHALKQSIDIYAEQQGGNYVTDVQVAQELPAVVNEWERSNTTCMRRIMARLHNLANVTSKFRVHETIGFKDTILNATADDLNNFANRYYTTDRATLLLVGNFSDASFKGDIMDHVHSVWGGLDATKCEHSRNEFDESVDLHNVGNREELMFVGDPGYNLVATCVPMERANMDVSIVNLLVSQVMNGSTGHLQKLVNGGFVQCVEAQASRTMASTPLFQIVMNCRCDMAQARGALTKALNVLPSEAAFIDGKSRLMDNFTNVFSDATQAAELIPQLMSYREGCGALAAHDLVTRCVVLHDVTYAKFSAAWAAITRRFSVSASTLLVMSSNDRVRAEQNVAPVVASQLRWSKPNRDYALRLLPSKMQWDIKSLQSRMHPIQVTTIHTDKVHMCGRLPSASVPYMMYLRNASMQTPPNTSLAFDVRGDHIGFTLTSKWESAYNAAQWLTSMMKAPPSADNVQAVEFSVNNTYHANPQCAVDYSASTLLSASSPNLNVNLNVLQQQQSRVLKNSVEINLILPKVMRRFGASVDRCHAEMLRVGSALQSVFRVRPCPYGRPLFPYTSQPAQTQQVACKSSISVCTIMIPCNDLRGKQLAALTILNSALGGDFNSMLMQHVRLELGLTYSTSSSVRMATTTSPMCITCTGSFAPKNSSAGTAAIQDVLERWSTIERQHFDFGKGVTLMRMASLCDIPAYGIGHSQFLRDIGTTQEEWVANVESVTYEDARRVLRDQVHFKSAITVASTL